MDNSGLGGGLLDLESVIPIHQQTHLGRTPVKHQHHLNQVGGFDNDNPHITLVEVKNMNTKEFAMNFGRGKSVSHINATNDIHMSEEDEPGFMEDGNVENSNGSKAKKGSLWQRMKWTNKVVRLLIAVVAHVGDDGLVDGAEGHKRKFGILQKKGKWKTVSKIMINKCCQVSPQQCEDKFNDLNKRYKRLNDILGRGASCQLVDNPHLVDLISHLSAKAKDDVRKILSSKHLFYKEMFAYHNGQRIPNCDDIDLQNYSEFSPRCRKDNNESEDEEADRNNDTEAGESDNEDDHNDDEVADSGELKKGSTEDGKFCSQTAGMDGFEVEMAKIFQDPSKSARERREWVKKQMLLLQDQRVSFQAEAFGLEKQRLKWMRYCSKKDRELASLRLENERVRLDNERMILHLRQKEMEIDFRRPEASLDPTSLGNILQGQDKLDLGRDQ